MGKGKIRPEIYKASSDTRWCVHSWLYTYCLGIYSPSESTLLYDISDSPSSITRFFAGTAALTPFQERPASIFIEKGSSGTQGSPSVVTPKLLFPQRSTGIMITSCHPAFPGSQFHWLADKAMQSWHILARLWDCVASSASQFFLHFSHVFLFFTSFFLGASGLLLRLLLLYFLLCVRMSFSRELASVGVCVHVCLSCASGASLCSLMCQFAQFSNLV